MSDKDATLDHPTDYISSADRKRPPEDTIALCLSGGGYRAMLFHLGTLWRLNEFGYLRRIDRISSVSGGSITAAVLGMNWSELGFNAEDRAVRFEEQLISPIRRLAGRSIDVKAIGGGIFFPGSVNEKLVSAYEKQLFGNRTLQDLPDYPRFIINATNVQSGALWRFTKSYMRDYRVGEVKRPAIPLAQAVAASSAFPPFLSPAHLDVDASAYSTREKEPLHRKPFLSRVVLTDGGVYDNLGLEAAWKRSMTVLVSDGGGQMQPDEDPHSDWARHMLRVLEVIDNQVRSLRKRLLISHYKRGTRNGTYFSVRGNIHDYPADHRLECPYARTFALAETPTRLKAVENDLQERLINWGYAMCDAAMRTWVEPSLPPPADFPYPQAGV